MQTTRNLIRYWFADIVYRFADWLTPTSEVAARVEPFMHPMNLGQVEMRVVPDGSVWLLVTRFGGGDPDGQGGYVVGELGGSGCRWVLYDPTDHEASLLRLERARAFHEARARSPAA